MDGISWMKGLSWWDVENKLPEMQESLKSLQTEVQKLPKVSLLSKHLICSLKILVTLKHKSSGILAGFARLASLFRLPRYDRVVIGAAAVN